MAPDLSQPTNDWSAQTWCSPELWAEVNGAVAYLLDRHPPIRAPLFDAAARIDAHLRLIDPLLERLCRQTCPFCPDPCCLRARIWFDCPDLLFLHLTRQPLPPSQPLSPHGARCRFLGPGGCVLPRRQRPWMCTLYLCPVQKGRLRRHAPVRLHFFDAVTAKIKLYRRRLETDFISAGR